VALRSSEQRYRNLLATAPLPILVHCDGIVLYLNQAATQLLQQPSAESLLGRSLLPFFSTDDDRGKLFQTFAGDLAAGGLHSLTLRIFLPPRELRDLEVTSIDLEYEGRRSQLMICLDVTEKLAAERELVEHRNRLEELVEERTVALRHTQEQLLLKERLAILGQLTATVSHELRNPMGSIGNALFNLQLAMEAKRDDLVVKSLQVANRSVERCDRIINELLDYSRKGNRESEELAIDHWLQELLGELVWPEQIRLRTELHSGIRIWGDTNRLRQAIQNLISNAQQALQEVDREDKVILVETRISDERLEIIVEDNGPGIPEDLQERIFEPLFSTKVYGVGLGTAVVEDVMRCHHGGVALQTPEDGGCRFVLWLPIGDDAGSNHGC
jgi:PAS domain S-box-containing protein